VRLRAAEKAEVIRLVEGSDLSVRRTLAELGVHRSTFYAWYRRYTEAGAAGLAAKRPAVQRYWNRIPPAVRFALAEAAASMIFVPAMATFGYLFADRALRIVHGAGRVEHWLVLGGLIGLALYLALSAWAARVPLDDGGPLRSTAPPPRDAVARRGYPPPPPRPPL
jgi:hypothetical protein